MKILDKYIFKSFVKLYLIILSSFIAIFLVVEFFEKFSKFLGESAKFTYIAAYFLLRTPYIVILSSPVTMLLAGLFLMHYMNKNNEIIAIRSAGISVMRMSLPLFIFAFFISGVMMFYGDRILSGSEQKREYIKDVLIFDKPVQNFKMRSNLQYKDGEGNLFYIGFFDGYRNKIKDIDISQFDINGKISRKIQAGYAIWENEKNENESDKIPPLVYYKVFVREFSDGKLTSFQRYNQKEFPQLYIQPQELVKSSKDPQEEMDYFELKEYIERLKRIGEEYQPELVELNLKIAFPLMNVIVLFFCIPIATFTGTGRSKSSGLGFVLAIGICFLYISIVRLGQSLGYNGILSPLFAAWFANIIFGFLGLVMLFRTGKY
ncbi:MAG: LptF/LptG family permease [Candidatus Cloacimonadota bacterium]|nr:LptF/LptG family permease [Candidatus Cloacimonadota bacterium]